MLLAFSSQSHAAGVLGQVEPHRQGLVLMLVEERDTEREWVCDMMSLWAAVELMRQQTWVSCQCHPEGDVSNNGCLSLIHCLVLYLYFVSSLTPSLSLTNHSFTLTHPIFCPPSTFGISPLKSFSFFSLTSSSFPLGLSLSPLPSL